MAYRGPNTTTSTSGKKVQTRPNSQKTFLVKNYLEQKLETQGYRGRVIYDATHKSLIQFRVKEGTIAVLKEGVISIFDAPVKKFKSSLPLEFESVEVDSIQTQKATCCKKCHSWKQESTITRCTCGGYLVSRKRFSVGTIESWDEEFLEMEFARADIRVALKIDSRPRKMAPYIPTGITAKLAGKSSVQPEVKPRKELLLIPKGDELLKIIVPSVRSCSLIFRAAIVTSSEKICSDVDEAEILREHDVKSSGDKQYITEVKQFLKNTSPRKAEILMDSWGRANNQTSPQNNSKITHKNFAKKSKGQYKKEKKDLVEGTQQFFVSSMPSQQKID